MPTAAEYEKRLAALEHRLAHRDQEVDELKRAVARNDQRIIVFEGLARDSRTIWMVVRVLLGGGIILGYAHAHGMLATIGKLIGIGK